MPEQHNIEWKTTWKDEYLKWICGFAKVQAVCQAKGSPAPKFEVLGEDMTVAFFAAGQGKTVQASGGNDQASGESDQASGGNDQASGGNDQASGGNDQALGETVQASGESVQASGETVQASGESVQASGESDQASGESDQASGESDQASGGSMLSRNKLERTQQEILAYCVEARSLGEISAKLGLRHLSYLRRVYIKPLLGSRLEMTHPENPRHMYQRYRTIVSDDKQK